MRISFLSLCLALFLACPVLAQDEIKNELIDSAGFLRDIREAHALRISRRVSEEEFIRMAGEPDTIILDARSADRYREMHIDGAKNLPFTDFTEAALEEVIPSKNTRILIYCNNNVENEPLAFALKSPAASLNLSTFPSLYTYGYRNIYELGPVIDPKSTQIRFVRN